MTRSLEEELRLARACASGDAQALQVMEREYLPKAREALLRRGVNAAAADEAVQTLRVRLFVGDAGRRPGIGTYEGRGPLSAWLRMSAVRTALNMERDRGAVLPTDARLEESAVNDTELAHLKDRYRADVSYAFRTALGQLNPRARTLLRLTFVEGVPAMDLGKTFGVDRSTVKRWLATARAELLELTRENLARRIHASQDELLSLIRALKSQLDVSLRQALAPTKE